MKNKNLKVMILFALLLLLLGGFVSHQPWQPQVLLAQEDTPTVTPADVTSTGSKAALFSTLGENPYTIADIAERANPAIVYIEVEWPAPTQTQRPRQSYDPFQDFFDSWFFGPNIRQPIANPTSRGSGFIIDNSGIVLTNQHVVGTKGEGQTVKVTISSPTINGEFDASIIGSDERLDLAVLQIEGVEGPFPTVTLGDSDSTRPGEWVIAIGNPYGKQFEHTVTVGVLSAKGREISIRNQETGTTQIYRNLMQTDAAINSGNSGGPLLNIEGQVIGINTAVHSQAQGIGFAIPINVATEVLDELINTGGVVHQLPPRSWLGIWYNQLNEELATRLGINDTKGIVIADVIHNSPAMEAGLQPLDIIRRVDNIDVTNTTDFSEIVAKKNPGDQLLLTVIRQGQSHFITVTLGNMPEELRD